MEIYILMTNDYDLDVFSSYQKAEAEMRKRYTEMVRQKGWNPDVPSDNYNISHNRADVYDGDDLFSWTICVRELNTD
jgi:esterase/lipase superfamily enzyme